MAELDDICHDEQLRIWAHDNIVGALAMGGFLRDLDYGEGIDLDRTLMHEVKNIVEMALDHPARAPRVDPDMLRDPVVVHLNMLRGGIAMLTDGQVKHLYPHLFKDQEPAMPEATKAAIRQYIANHREAIDYGTTTVRIPDGTVFTYDKMINVVNELARAEDILAAFEDGRLTEGFTVA
jgi:hypothetical protein